METVHFHECLLDQACSGKSLCNTYPKFGSDAFSTVWAPVTCMDCLAAALNKERNKQLATAIGSINKLITEFNLGTFWNSK